MTATLPFSEPFNYPDGNLWPQGGDGGWVIPGADGMHGGSGDVFGGRGRVLLTQDWIGGTPQFSARLPIDDAPTFNVSFTLDIYEMVPLASVSGGNFWLHVQLENTATGVVFYEIALNSDDGLQAAMYKYGVWPAFPAGGFQSLEYVPLSNIDPTLPISVRIVETGHLRSFKVWQGPEPSDWTVQDGTGNAPIHSGSRNLDIKLFSQQNGAPNVYLDDIAVNTPGSVATYTLIGRTDHFNFWYETSLGNRGLVDGTDAMAYAETDLLNHFAWFGSTAKWSDGPARLDIKFDNTPVTDFLATYSGYTEGVHIAWGTGGVYDQHVDNDYRGTWIHEIVHHFQTLQNRGIINTESMCEAHAAFLEREWYRKIGDFDALGTTNTYSSGVVDWLNSADRPDYVNQTMATQDPLPTFRLAVGCTMLFLHYLHTHRGYSPVAITQAAAANMRLLYRNLTGDPADPFQTFYDPLLVAFPSRPLGTFDFLSWPSHDPANPYPLPGGANPVRGGGVGVAYVNGLPISPQGLKALLGRK